MDNYLSGHLYNEIRNKYKGAIIAEAQSFKEKNKDKLWSEKQISIYLNLNYIEDMTSNLYKVRSAIGNRGKTNYLNYNAPTKIIL